MPPRNLVGAISSVGVVVALLGAGSCGTPSQPSSQAAAPVLDDHPVVVAQASATVVATSIDELVARADLVAVITAEGAEPGAKVEEDSTVTRLVEAHVEEPLYATSSVPAQLRFVQGSWDERGRGIEVEGQGWAEPPQRAVVFLLQPDDVGGPHGLVSLQSYVPLGGDKGEGAGDPLSTAMHAMSEQELRDEIAASAERVRSGEFDLDAHVAATLAAVMDRATTAGAVTVSQGETDGRRWSLVAAPTPEGFCWGIGFGTPPLRMCMGLAGLRARLADAENGSVVVFIDEPAVAYGVVAEGVETVQIRDPDGQVVADRVPTVRVGVAGAEGLRVFAVNAPGVERQDQLAAIAN